MRRWIFLYSDSGSQPPATGCGIILGIPLVMGLLYLIVSGEAKVADSAMQLSLALNAGVVLWLVIQLFLGRLHFSVDIKRFLRGLGIGLIVYIGITAVLILMGLVANLGTGHPISDPVSDKMELAAMLMGAPFLWHGFFTR